MAGIWDFLDSMPKRGDVSPEELARRRQGYADAYQNSFLARNRDQMPLSVQGAQATQDFLPLVGDALALAEAGDAFSRGELAAAGLLGAGAAIGLVPGAGDALAKPVMAAGRRAADIARRIEVDPNALGSMGGNIRLKPESVSPAQEVAGLLSSGRANEVTDEMLAKFTPNDEKEMFDLYQRGATGMDLPMDEASRMARAGDMGFDTGVPLYHGTATDFAAFDNRRTGTNDAGLWGRGHYFAASPEVASSYALRQGDGAMIIPSQAVIQNAMPVRTGSDLITRLPDGTNTRDLTGPNLDGVKIKNIAQSSGFDGVTQFRPDGNIGDTVAYDPTNIRSRFARFDPRLAHLRNLSAGVGGLGLLSSMMPPEEQY